MASLNFKLEREILTSTGSDDMILKPIDKLEDLDVLFKHLKKNPVILLITKILIDSLIG